MKELYISNIIKKTGLSRRDIEHLLVKKQQDLNEISKQHVLYAMCKEFSINVKLIHESFQI